MANQADLRVLSEAFTRVYRSFGQYLAQAWLTFDVGEETIKCIMERERQLAERLGAYLMEAGGALNPGLFPLEYGDVHYLYVSRIVADWLPRQRRLVHDLRADRAHVVDASNPGVAILDQVIALEEEALRVLNELLSTSAAYATSA